MSAPSNPIIMRTVNLTDSGELVTLRDLFAAACVGALFSDAADDARQIKNSEVARAAYQMADAMLAERAK